ncbi:MAG: SPOR domain-containing protein [Bacteroidetes bacterium]|nr:SPOR domain-containing protein [Bacteroidota bacterium]
MRKKEFIVFVFIAWTLQSCVLSEHQSGHERSSLLVNELRSDTVQQPNKTGENTLPLQSQSPPLHTVHDTVHATTVVEYSSNSILSSANTTKAESIFYTIQVGAYGDASNALRCQKITKERFPTYQVFNDYDGVTKIYRISVGQFSTKDSAFIFLKQLQQQYPREYRECWVKQLEF